MREFDFGTWQVTAAAECGGNFAGIHWRGREIMHGFSSAGQWCSAPTDYGFPVLFPPNRIADGIVRFGKREYRLPVNEIERSNHLHGIALREKWEYGECSGNSVNMFWEFDQNSPMYADYPFGCRLSVTYTFGENDFEQRFQVENRSGAGMPCALGFHSAFAAPERVLVHGKGGRIEILPPRYLGSGRETGWENGFEPGKWCCPADVWPFGHLQMDDSHAAELDYVSFKVEYTVDSKFSHWMVWRPEQDKTFLCIEPMNIRVGDFENVPESLPVLEPGACRSFISRVKILTQ